MATVVPRCPDRIRCGNSIRIIGCYAMLVGTLTNTRAAIVKPNTDCKARSAHTLVAKA